MLPSATRYNHRDIALRASHFARNVLIAHALRGAQANHSHIFVTQSRFPGILAGFCGAELLVRQWKPKVFPSLACQDFMDSRRTNAELTSNLNLAHLMLPKGKNLANLIAVKFGHAITFSFRLSVLRNFIRNIVLMCAEKQMFRIHARRIIAFVEHEMFGGNVTKMNIPRDAVSPTKMFVAAVKKAVSIKVSAACPKPTRTQFRSMFRNRPAFVDFWPKSIGNGLLHKAAQFVGFHFANGSMVPMESQ